MKIVNIVDDFSPVNLGIWNAAIATSSLLAEMGHKSYLLYPKIAEKIKVQTSVEKLPLDELGINQLRIVLEIHDINPKNSIIETHGCWQYPTKWGRILKNMGFKWVCTPHGMLEPWSLAEKKMKKLTYFHFMEKPKLKKADIIRAVGEPEKRNLQNLLPKSKISLIPNGVDSVNDSVLFKNQNPSLIVFISRLHHKKGVTPLVQAWLKSKLFMHKDYKLIIAGPNQGELGNIQSILKNINSPNVEYIGSVYGEEKKKLLKQASFFILPSFSEGFPTSILEAMSFGQIPLATEGCNFNEIFTNGLGIKITPRIDNIVEGLNKIIDLSQTERNSLAMRNQTFINENYSLHTIARKQHELYESLL